VLRRRASRVGERTEVFEGNVGLQCGFSVVSNLRPGWFSDDQEEMQVVLNRNVGEIFCRGMGVS
jgi:hypothetical protein